MRKQAVVDVAVEVMEHALQIPGGHSIVGVRFDPFAKEMRLVIEGPSVPSSDEFDAMPRMRLICDETARAAELGDIIIMRDSRLSLIP